MEQVSALKRCLEWVPDAEFGIPTPEKLLRQLREDYPNRMRSFLEILEGADEAERGECLPLIFEVLYEAANQNDGASIRRLFALCPGLSRDGYECYDQTLPLGEAIEHCAYDAIDAFVAAGCSLHTVSWAGYSAIEHALNCDCGEEMVLHLLERVGEVTFAELALAWDENPELAEKMIARARHLPQEWSEEEEQAYPELAACLKGSS